LPEQKIQGNTLLNCQQPMKTPWEKSSKTFPGSMQENQLVDNKRIGNALQVFSRISEECIDGAAFAFR